ncbi:protocadherin beta-6-like isoform X1, partial [Lates japonicus]
SRPSTAAPQCRNSVISERNSTIADSTLVSNDAYWYSLFLAETRKGKLVVRQPLPKGSRYIVSSIPRGTGLTETSDSAASTLQDNGAALYDTIKVSTVETAVKAYSDMTEVPLERGNLLLTKTFDYEIEKEFLFHMRPETLALLLLVNRSHCSLCLITIKVNFVSEHPLKTYSDMTEIASRVRLTRKELGDRQATLPKGLPDIVSSIPTGTGLTETSDSAASTLQCQKPKPNKAAPQCRNSVISERNSTIADSTLVSNDAYWYSLFLAETGEEKQWSDSLYQRAPDTSCPVYQEAQG